MLGSVSSLAPLHSWGSSTLRSMHGCHSSTVLKGLAGTPVLASLKHCNAGASDRPWPGFAHLGHLVSLLGVPRDSVGLSSLQGSAETPALVPALSRVTCIPSAVTVACMQPWDICSPVLGLLHSSQELTWLPHLTVPSRPLACVCTPGRLPLGPAQPFSGNRLPGSDTCA